MLPHVGGNWNNGANAGSFAVNLNNDSSNTNQNVGVRAVRFQHIPLPDDGGLFNPSRAVLKGGFLSRALCVRTMQVWGF
jgi:hypothetical protein